MYDTDAVASNIIEISTDYGGVSPLKLQKTLYILSGFYQSKNKEVLLNRSFDAWRHGPVINGIYHDYKSHRYTNISNPVKDFKIITDIEDLIVDVLSSTRNVDATILSEMTHVEPPWLLKYGRPFTRINNDLISNYFGLFDDMNEYLDSGHKRLDFREIGKKRKKYIENLSDLKDGWDGENSIKPSAEVIKKFQELVTNLVFMTLSNNIKVLPVMVMGPIPRGGFSIEFRIDDDIFVVRRLNSGEYSLEVMQGNYYCDYKIDDCDPEKIFNDFMMGALQA